MGLFSRFNSNTFESMDELEQMELAAGLGITDIKKDIRSIKARLTDLENSSNWKANIITAIDPDKTYILPLDGTENSKHLKCYAYYNFGHWLTTGPMDDAWAIRREFVAEGKALLDNAPDWVKTIKPIEVKE